MSTIQGPRVGEAAVVPTAASQVDAGAGRRLPGWVAAVVLVVGLAIVWWLVAHNHVDLKTLTQIHADSASTHEVAQIYVPDWRSADYNPLVGGNLRALTPLLTLLYLVSVSAIGAAVVDAMRGARAWPRAARWLAGFLPGYLVVLAPLQIAYAGLSTRAAGIVALIAIPAVALWLHRDTLRGAAGRRPTGGILTAVALVAGIVVAWTLFRLQAGRNFMVPDSITAFLNAAIGQAQGSLGAHLAQWDQQSDEWVFNAPLIFTLGGAVTDQLFAFWMTQVVATASFCALVFGVVHTVAPRRKLLAAWIATGAVLASSPAITPWHEISLFGGQNPSMWIGHPGRMIGIVGPWVALLLIARPARRTTTALLLLLAAGLAFCTINATAYIVVALVCAAAWHVLRGLTRSDRPVVGWAVGAMAVLALAAPLWVYYEIHRTFDVNAVGYYLPAGAALAMLGAVVLALTARPGATRRIDLRLPAALAVALVAGFFLSNNIVSSFADGKVRSALATVLPGFDQAVNSRDLVPTRHIDFPVITGQECSITGHCVDFPHFLAAYGFILVVALAAWLALAGRRRRAAWLVTVAAFVAAFALVDFTGSDLVTAWVLTRFLEVPYYALLGIAALAFASSRSRATVIVGCATLVTWTAVAIVASHIPAQLLKNADYLIARISS